jgi:hypothetical protein
VDVYDEPPGPLLDLVAYKEVRVDIKHNQPSKSLQQAHLCREELDFSRLRNRGGSKGSPCILTTAAFFAQTEAAAPGVRVEG